MIPESLQQGFIKKARANLYTVAMTPHGDAQQDSDNLTQRAQVLREVEAETAAALDAYYQAIVTEARARIVLDVMHADDERVQQEARRAHERLTAYYADADGDGPYCNVRDANASIHAATVHSAMLARAIADHQATIYSVCRARSEAERLTAPND